MNANVTYWQSVLREAERDLDAATVKSTVNAAGRKLMRARRELRALGVGWDGGVVAGAARATVITKKEPRNLGRGGGTSGI
jgi:hypothetical protein